MTLPLTVLGGYLGAGKTTLVNKLLREGDGERIAILVNDFGELAVDADLIEAEDGDIISLAGGCVCCSYGDDLMSALMSMRNMEPPPQRIVLEASGIAMPGAIGASIGLVPGIELSSIIVLADAEHMPAHLANSYLTDTIERQLNSADLIVITKADIAAADTVRDLIAHTAPGLPVVDADQVSNALIFANRSARPAVEPHGAHHHTELLIFDGAVDVEALAQDLATDRQIVRAKGVVPTSDGTLALLQLTDSTWAVSPAPPDASLGVVVISIP
ncbi:CobW family GTP-binding protein [Roseobacter sp. MH60115]|uniref:CobW family GTP-binding protein n=1 Tax=Roseobacter sp. MH60115 TaxID=2785324 RepID=UPI0018A2D87F|nr:GTP-binding protein [Roseobacter sp. MH60115]